MKVFYIDDQKVDIPVVEGALTEIQRFLKVDIAFEFIGPAVPGELQLHFDEEAQPNITGLSDGGVSAERIVAAAASPGSIYLVDVRFPHDDDYGLQLARFLVRKHDVPPAHIVLFTLVPEAVHQAEQGPEGQAWFTYFPKAKFRLPAANTRLAYELVGVVQRVLVPPVVQLPQEGTGGLVGRAPIWLECLRQIQRAAATDYAVLLRGESGTGKEHLARLVHELSRRSADPFGVIEVGTIPRELVTSELFGYGPNSGIAQASRHGQQGRIESLVPGTAFLDEIAEIPLEVQPRLFRLVAEREIAPLGQLPVRKLNIRIVAATNRPLEQLVEQGQFREELLQRLNAVEISVPPLRHRREDIPELAKYFMAQLRDQLGVERKVLSTDAVQFLQDMSWTVSNVRELQNTLIRAHVKIEGPILTADALRRVLGAGSEAAAGRAGSRSATRAIAPDGAAATWESLYRDLPYLSGRVAHSPRRDRDYFIDVLLCAAHSVSEPKSRSWLRALLHVLAANGPVLLTRLRGGEARFLSYIMGVLAIKTTPGRTFLTAACGIPKEIVDARISKVEKGSGHAISGSWERLGAADEVCCGVLESLIREVEAEVGGAAREQ